MTDAEHVWRTESPHVLAALLRRHGDLGDCEDAVQEALAAAAMQWPVEGMPDRPRAWLIRVAHRRLVDAVRSDVARRERELADLERTPDDARASPAADASLPRHDDTLRLLLLCCHPALTPAGQIALTLRAVAGMSTTQIAAAFLVQETTMAQRIARAKRTLREAGARFAMPRPEELGDRVAAVARVLTLAFSEGHAATTGEDLVDGALQAEALRLTRMLHAAVPEDDEVAGALALMLLVRGRAPARVDAAGELVPLEEQDRSTWDAVAIAEGIAILERVLPRGTVGPLQLQASIAAVHADAPTWEATDWPQIAVLYGMLERVDPSPMATLGRAVAIGMVRGPVAGLAIVEPLTIDRTMREHHRTWAVRAHLLERASRPDEARDDFERAARMTPSPPERRHLLRCAAQVGAHEAAP